MGVEPARGWFADSNIARRGNTMRPAGVESEKSAKVRAAILDATEQIMKEAGYAAVSSRKVEGRAGLKSQLVHYYFRTMDELFAAVWQRYDDRFLENQARVLSSDRPLRALWERSIDPETTTLRHEFIALANHRETIRELVARSTKRILNMQVAAIKELFERHEISPTDLSPVVLVQLFSFVSRSLITQRNLGLSEDHAEIVQFIDQTIARIEATIRQRQRSTKDMSTAGKRTPRRHRVAAQSRKK
jgi:TetR/AcrR family transcriptional regulator